MGGRPLAIAHRGDPLSARENTLAAFDAAQRAGADMIELDLRRTADGEIVVLHDPTLARLWNRDVPVAAVTLADLRTLGDHETRIPTLREVLDAVEVPLMLDFTGRDVVAGTVREVRDAGATSSCLFVSGNLEALSDLRSAAPEVCIGITWTSAVGPAPGLLRALGAEYWNPVFALVDPDRVEARHRMGVKVSTWTVDAVGDMARVRDDGVDAIVTNRIADLVGLLGPPGW